MSPFLSWMYFNELLSISCCSVQQVYLFGLEDNLVDALKWVLKRPGYKKSPSHFVHFLLDKISHISVKVCLTSTSGETFTSTYGFDSLKLVLINNTNLLSKRSLHNFDNR